jgi:hypothetical protein
MALRNPVRFLLAGAGMLGLTGCNLNEMPFASPAGPVALATR